MTGKCQGQNGKCGYVFNGMDDMYLDIVGSSFGVPLCERCFHNKYPEQYNLGQKENVSGWSHKK